MALGTPIDGGPSTGTTVNSVGYPATVNSTDAVVLFVWEKPTTANTGSVTTPTGYTLIQSIIGAGGYGTTTGADVGNTNLYVYRKNSVTGSEGGTFLSISASGASVEVADIVAIPTGGSTISFAAATGSDTTAGNVSAAMDVDPGFDAGDVAIWAMCIPTDVTTPSQFSAHNITASGVTFGTKTELNEIDSSIGNDIGGYIAWAPVTAGPSSGVATITATAGGTTTNVRGPLLLLRIREGTGGGGTTYNESLTESIALAQSFTNKATFNDTRSETIALAVSEAASNTISASLSEAIALADAVSGGLSYTVTLSESIMLDAAQTAATIFNPSLTEAITLADSLTASNVLSVALSESVTLADAVSALAVFSSSLSEAVSLTDSVTVGANVYNEVINEAIGLADSLAASLTIAASVSESISLADAVSTIRIYNETLSEAITLTDSAAAQATFSVALSETISLNVTYEAKRGGGWRPVQPETGNWQAQPSGTTKWTVQSKPETTWADKSKPATNWTRRNPSDVTWN